MASERYTLTRNNSQKTVRKTQLSTKNIGLLYSIPKDCSIYLIDGDGNAEFPNEHDLFENLDVNVVYQVKASQDSDDDKNGLKNTTTQPSKQVFIAPQIAKEKKVQEFQKGDNSYTKSNYLERLQQITKDTTTGKLKELMDDLSVTYPYLGKYGGGLESLGDVPKSNQPFEIFREEKPDNDEGTGRIAYHIKYFYCISQGAYTYSGPVTPGSTVHVRPHDSACIYTQRRNPSVDTISSRGVNGDWLKIIPNLKAHLQAFT